MEKIVAYCGLCCNECPAYNATVSSDNEALARIAEDWSGGEYQFTADDIKCMGCLTATSTLFSFCNECDIRLCARQKGHVNCAYCDDYPCDVLGNVFEKSPTAKLTLDVIREELNSEKEEESEDTGSVHV